MFEVECALARRAPAVPIWVIVTVGVLVLSGCTIPRGQPTEVEPMRVSEMLTAEDPARRASTRLVIEGLDADAVFNRERARGSYERAVRVDPTNPFGYLALARHELDDRDADRALQLIDQAAALFESEGLKNDRVGPHINGLRGRAYEGIGRASDAELYRARAAEIAPTVWGDGYLSPEELR